MRQEKTNQPCKSASQATQKGDAYPLIQKEVSMNRDAVKHAVVNSKYAFP